MTHKEFCKESGEWVNSRQGESVLGLRRAKIRLGKIKAVYSILWIGCWLVEYSGQQFVWDQFHLVAERSPWCCWLVPNQSPTSYQTANPSLDSYATFAIIMNFDCGEMQCMYDWDFRGFKVKFT